MGKPKKDRVHIALGGELLKRVRAQTSGTGFTEKEWVFAATRRALDEAEAAKAAEAPATETKAPAAPRVEGNPGF